MRRCGPQRGRLGQYAGPDPVPQLAHTTRRSCRLEPRRRVNTSDFSAYLSAKAAAGTFGGRGVLSSLALDIRFGYAGYQWDQPLSKYRARHRVYDPFAGRWINRDPIVYDAGTWNLYEYVYDSPLVEVDPLGLQQAIPGGGEGDPYKEQDYRPRPDEDTSTIHGFQKWITLRCLHNQRLKADIENSEGLWWTHLYPKRVSERVNLAEVCISIH